MMRALFLAEGSEKLARDETVLWKGRPLVVGLVRHLFHLRVIIGYFAVLAAWNLASAHADGFRANAAFVTAVWTVLPAVAAAVIVYAMAWLLASTTSYTVTDKRVIMQIGVALPIALTLPLRQICSADLRTNPDGSGDISLALGAQKLAYLLIWPHARPWRLKLAEPMLRAVPDACAVAETLARALVAVSPGSEAVAITKAAGPDRVGVPVTA